MFFAVELENGGVVALVAVKDQQPMGAFRTTRCMLVEVLDPIQAYFVGSSDVIGLEAIWIGLDLSENCWTGFGFLEDLDWIGLIGNQLLELQ
ncbi:hypothetical protein BFJ66_g18125 [Fusarium oxysporum f. sp. cepae]|nr:hypothetical protein BFJ66_g18125 [Fusarium oxysporum f. sp. cepae]